MIKLLNILKELKIQPDYPKLIMLRDESEWGGNIYWVQEIINLFNDIGDGDYSIGDGDYSWSSPEEKGGDWTMYVYGKEERDKVKQFLNNENIPYEIYDEYEEDEDYECYFYINDEYIEVVDYLDENLDELRILPEEKFIKFKYNYDDGFYYSEFINDETDGYFPWILQENKVGKEYLYCKVDKIDAKIIEEILRNYFKITDWDIFPDRVSDRYHILIYNFIEDKDT